MSLWVRGCHVGPQSRRCFRAKAAESQCVRRPGCMSAGLTTLRARVCRSKSLGDSSGPKARMGLHVLRQSCFSFGSSLGPSLLLAIPSLVRAGSPPLLLGSRPRPPPPFLCHKVYLQQKGARSEQPRGRERELEREREGRQAGWRAQSRGRDPDRARPRAMLRVAPAGAGTRPGDPR